VRQIFPAAGDDLELITTVTAGPLPASVETLAALYRDEPPLAAPDRPWLRANMIASADGAAHIGSQSGALGGPADRMLFWVLRSLADVILVGAGTARTERYHPVSATQVWPALRAGKPPAPAIAVVSYSLDLDPCSRLLTDAAAYAQTIVVTPATAPADRAAVLAEKAKVLVCGQDNVDLGAAVTALGGMGYRHILVEGGPRLLGELVEAGLLDELCLTTSPVLVAGPAGRIVTSPDAGPRSAPAASLSLAHVLADDGFLLSRYIRSAG
jgi:riboflavin biosynthesis pyrimidine reductase